MLPDPWIPPILCILLKILTSAVPCTSIVVYNGMLSGSPQCWIAHVQHIQAAYGHFKSYPIVRTTTTQKNTMAYTKTYPQVKWPLQMNGVNHEIKPWMVSFHQNNLINCSNNVGLTKIGSVEKVVDNTLTGDIKSFRHILTSSAHPSLLIRLVSSSHLRFVSTKIIVLFSFSLIISSINLSNLIKQQKSLKVIITKTEDF